MWEERGESVERAADVERGGRLGCVISRMLDAGWVGVCTV